MVGRMGAHGVCSYFAGIGPGLPNVQTVGTSRASRQTVRDLTEDELAAIISIIEAAYEADLGRLHDEVASLDDVRQLMPSGTRRRR